MFKKNKRERPKREHSRLGLNDGSFLAHPRLRLLLELVHVEARNGVEKATASFLLLLGVHFHFLQLALAEVLNARQHVRSWRRRGRVRGSAWR